MKHLKIRGKLSKDKRKVEVVILEQTHRCDEFGPERSQWASDYYTKFFHGGFELCSYDQPAYYSDQSVVFYLRGRYTEGDSHKTMIPLSIWPKLKAAVIAYNKWGESQ